MLNNLHRANFDTVAVLTGIPWCISTDASILYTFLSTSSTVKNLLSTLCVLSNLTLFVHFGVPRQAILKLRNNHAIEYFLIHRLERPQRGRVLHTCISRFVRSSWSISTSKWQYRQRFTNCANLISIFWANTPESTIRFALIYSEIMSPLIYGTFVGSLMSPNG